MSLRLVDPDAQDAAEAGLSLLDRRDVTESQMREYLADKGFSADAVNDVVSAFAGRGWLNDRNYADEFLRQRASKAGMSRAKLRADMEKRGLDPEAVAASLAILDAENPDWETDNALKLLQSKLAAAQRGLDLETREGRQKLQAKLWRYGASRGFSSATMSTVVSQVLHG